MGLGLSSQQEGQNKTQQAVKGRPENRPAKAQITSSPVQDERKAIGQGPPIDSPEDPFTRLGIGPT